MLMVRQPTGSTVSDAHGGTETRGTALIRCEMKYASEPVSSGTSLFFSPLVSPKFRRGCSRGASGGGSAPGPNFRTKSLYDGEMETKGDVILPLVVMLGLRRVRRHLPAIFTPLFVSMRMSFPRWRGLQRHSTAILFNRRC